MTPDDTLRLSADGAATLSQAQLRDIVDAAVDAMVVVDGDGEIRFANPAALELFGRDYPDLVGRDFGHPLTRGEPARIDIIRGDGERASAEMRAGPVRWSEDAATLVVLRDVRDPVNAELARLQTHIRGLSLRLTQLEQRLSGLEARIDGQAETPAT